jgi:hypothetical protein
MPDVYASLKIVIDDAHESARIWGGTNSRVFDAIAGGALPITNSQASQTPISMASCPSGPLLRICKRRHGNGFGTRQPASNGYSSFRAIVAARHTYTHRARAFREALQTRFEVARVAIKIGAPDKKSASAWGDSYLARDLAKLLRQRGVRVTIQTMDSWYGGEEHVDAVHRDARAQPLRAATGGSQSTVVDQPSSRRAPSTS